MHGHVTPSLDVRYKARDEDRRPVIAFGGAPLTSTATRSFTLPAFLLRMSRRRRVRECNWLNANQSHAVFRIDPDVLCRLWGEVDHSALGIGATVIDPYPGGLPRFLVCDLRMGAER